jgi:hypothetical protein
MPLQYLVTATLYRGNGNRQLIEARFGRGRSLWGESPAASAASQADSMYQDLDAYGILEIPRDASRTEVKKAYLKAISKWHPDKWHRSDEASKTDAKLRSVAINFAHFCLEDAERRARYDAFGATDMESFLAAEKCLEAEAKALLDELITNKTVDGNHSVLTARGVFLVSAAPFRHHHHHHRLSLTSLVCRCRCKGGGEGAFRGGGVWGGTEGRVLQFAAMCPLQRDGSVPYASPHLLHPHLCQTAAVTDQTFSIHSVRALPRRRLLPRQERSLPAHSPGGSGWGDSAATGRG